jgi:hypothetical protein
LVICSLGRQRGWPGSLTHSIGPSVLLESFSTHTKVSCLRPPSRARRSLLSTPSPAAYTIAMTSRPYNQWPQNNGFASQQTDFNFYSSNDRQQEQQQSQQSFSALYPQTTSSLTNAFGETQQQPQGGQYVRSSNTVQTGGQPQGGFAFGQSQSPSPSLSLNVTSLQPFGSMIHDSPGPMQNQFPKGSRGPGAHQPSRTHYPQPSASGNAFHQSKRPRPSRGQEDSEHDGELSPEKEGGKKQ